MTMSCLSMASPSELLRSRCPLPTTTQRRHWRLPGERALRPRSNCCAALGLPLSSRAQGPSPVPQSLVPGEQASPRGPGPLWLKRKWSGVWQGEEERCEDDWGVPIRNPTAESLACCRGLPVALATPQQPLPAPAARCPGSMLLRGLMYLPALEMGRLGNGPNGPRGTSDRTGGLNGGAGWAPTASHWGRKEKALGLQQGGRQSPHRRMLSGMEELVMARTRRSTSSAKRTDRKGLMPLSLFHSSGLCLPSAPLPRGGARARLRAWALGPTPASPRPWPGCWAPTRRAKKERVAKVTHCPHNPRQCLPLPLVP